jgi:plasmid stability protein
MKTTLDLPDALVNEIKQRAVREGRDVNEVVADLLNAGVSPELKSVPANGQTVPKTLPLIKVRPAQPADARKLTTQEWCDWIKEVDLRLEVERYEKTLGHQHVDRAGA